MIEESCKNKHIDEVEPVFRSHNQPTTIYRILNDNEKTKVLLKKFGTNEGGPSYIMFIDEKDHVTSIQKIDVMDYLLG